MEIKEINHGIACRIGDTIYINKVLNKDKKLKNFLLDHEKNHSKRMTVKDIKMDLHLFNKQQGAIKNRYLYMLRCYPSTWTEFLPFMWYGGKLVLNIKLIVLYFFMGVLLWLINILL